MNEKKFILHVCFLLFWLAAFVVVLIYSWFSYKIQIVPLGVSTFTILGCSACAFLIERESVKAWSTFRFILPIGILLISAALCDTEQEILQGIGFLLICAFGQPFRMPFDYLLQGGSAATSLSLISMLLPWLLFLAAAIAGKYSKKEKEQSHR